MEEGEEGKEPTTNLRHLLTFWPIQKILNDMNAADVVIITAILTSIVMVALLAIFAVKAVKQAAFRWRWIAMGALLVILWISGEWSIGMMLLIISGSRDWGFGGGIITLLGFGGFILVPLCVFAIKKLARPMNIA